jgi:hypothetical protein
MELHAQGVLTPHNQPKTLYIQKVQNAFEYVDYHTRFEGLPWKSQGAHGQDIFF